MQNAARIKQLMQTIQNAANPQAALNMMAMNSPQLKYVMDIVNQHGGDPMAAFRAEAQARGMDPDEIMNMLK